MPLAVVQVAAFINQRALQCLVREYIEKFQKTDRSKTSLLTHVAGHHRRDRDAKNSIILTWQISFNYIHQERPSAADLLSLMSLLENPDGNYEGHEDEDSGSETSVTDEVEDDI
jgi:hypothetical protein